MDDEIASLKHQLRTLKRNLMTIEDQEYDFFDSRSIPPDLKEAERVTRDKIAEIEGQLAALEPSQAPGKPVDISFVIVAMNRQEASALLAETIPDNPEVASQRTRLQELKRFFRENEIENWLSHYQEDREDWIPRTCSEKAIREIVDDVVARVNNRPERATLPSIRPRFRSADFFAEHGEDLQETTWRELADLGCVLIIDTISLLHPHVHQTLTDSEMGSEDQVAMLILSPVNPCTNEANQWLEQEIHSRMKRAFARFDKRLDKLCEVGVGDLRTLRRRLFAILPEAAKNVEEKQPNRAMREHMRDMLGEPRGADKLVFGQRGR